MNPSPVPPVVAGFAGVATAVARRLSALLLESSLGVPSPRALSLTVLGGRFATFVLVYGLLFGVAYRLGARRPDGDGDVSLALVSGAVGALGYLVGTGTVLSLVEFDQDAFVTALATGGSGLAVGVQLAVVTFAGVALARRRRPAPEPHSA